MRISCHHDDPGYHVKAQGSKIFVDGKEIQRCYTADEMLGVAYVYDTDENGDIKIDKSKYRCMTKVLRGEVKIICPAINRWWLDEK